MIKLVKKFDYETIPEYENRLNVLYLNEGYEIIGMATNYSFVVLFKRNKNANTNNT